MIFRGFLMSGILDKARDRVLGPLDGSRNG
jgi:hypothetical protein